MLCRLSAIVGIYAISSVVLVFSEFIQTLALSTAIPSTSITKSNNETTTTKTIFFATTTTIKPSSSSTNHADSNSKQGQPSAVLFFTTDATTTTKVVAVSGEATATPNVTTANRNKTFALSASVPSGDNFSSTPSTEIPIKSFIIRDDTSTIDAPLSSGSIVVYQQQLTPTASTPSKSLPTTTPTALRFGTAAEINQTHPSESVVPQNGFSISNATNLSVATNATNFSLFPQTTTTPTTIAPKTELTNGATDNKVVALADATTTSQATYAGTSRPTLVASGKQVQLPIKPIQNNFAEGIVDRHQHLTPPTEDSEAYRQYPTETPCLNVKNDDEDDDEGEEHLIEAVRQLIAPPTTNEHNEDFEAQQSEGVMILKPPSRASTESTESVDDDEALFSTTRSEKNEHLSTASDFERELLFPRSSDHSNGASSSADPVEAFESEPTPAYPTETTATAKPTGEASTTPATDPSTLSSTTSTTKQQTTVMETPTATTVKQEGRGILDFIKNLIHPSGSSTENVNKTTTVAASTPPIVPSITPSTPNTTAATVIDLRTTTAIVINATTDTKEKRSFENGYDEDVAVKDDDSHSTIGKVDDVMKNDTANLYTKTIINDDSNAKNNDGTRVRTDLRHQQLTSASFPLTTTTRDVGSSNLENNESTLGRKENVSIDTKQRWL